MQPVISWTNLPNFNEANVNALQGSEVFATPQLNQDLIIRTSKNTIVNLGRVVSASLEDGSGRNFIVTTNRMPSASRLFVKLATEVRTIDNLNR